MKNWTRISLFSAFISVCLHFYLILHFYPLRFGFSQESAACNINQTFNCDAVSASSFAELFGIPLAAYGFATNVILFVVIMLGWLNWSVDSRKFRATATQISLLSAMASLVMIAISFSALKQHCIVCLALHALALVILYANLKIEKPTWSDWLPADNAGLKAGVALGIPLLAFIVHKSYLQSYGADGIQRSINNAVLDWQAAPTQNFVAKPLLTKGASEQNATMVIREFADLLCHHCKAAAPSLAAFTDSHSSDVRFEFYVFPLDGNCNPEMKSSNGLSCALSRILVCAEKQNLGWVTKGILFEHQNDLITVGHPDEITNKALEFLKNSGLDQTQIRECIKDPQINDILAEQSKQGKLAQVEGTPTVYVSNKKLPRGQMIPVLQAVHKMIKDASQAK